MNNTLANISSKMLVLLFIFFLTAYMLIQSGHIYTADGAIRYRVAKNIVEHHTSSISKKRECLLVQGRNKKYYSTYGIGQSLLLIPLYLSGKLLNHIAPCLKLNYITEFMASLLNAIITSLTCVVIFLFGINLGYSRKTSFSLSLIYGFGTMAIVYVKDSQEVPQIALLLLLVFYFLHKYSTTRKMPNLIASSIALGIALITRLPTLMIIAPVCIYLFFERFKKNKSLKTRKELNFVLKEITIFLIALIPWVGIGMGYNYLRFNSVFKTGYLALWANWEGGASNILFGNPFCKGVYKLWLSPGGGLIFYTPIVILTLLFWPIFHKSNRKLSISFIMIILLYTIFYAKNIYAIAVFSWGPRFIAPILPFLVLPLGSFFESRWFLKKRVMKFLSITLIAISAVIQMPAVLTNYQISSYAINVSKSEGNFANNLSNSPLLKQWKMLSGVLHSMASGKSRELSLEVPKSANSKEVLIESRTFNILDIWYVHLYYLGFPKKLLLSSVIFLIILLGVLGYFIHRQILLISREKMTL